MFARVSTYEGGDPASQETLRFLQEHVVPAARTFAGWKGMYFLADLVSAKTLSITLWDSEGSLRASEEAADKLRAEATRQAGSQTTKVERFEVVTADAEPPSDAAGTGKCARVSRYQIPVDKVDAAIGLRTGQAATEVRRIPGNNGAYLLIDRKTGAALSVTLWESEQALKASEETANQIRARNSESINATISGVERYVITATAGEHAPVPAQA